MRLLFYGKVNKYAIYIICIFNDIFCINEHMKGDFSQNMRI